MKKKLNYWKAGCIFERLARLHDGRKVAFKNGSHTWELTTNGNYVHVRLDGKDRGSVNIQEGTYDGLSDSIMDSKAVFNIVDRINEGHGYVTPNNYKFAILAMVVRETEEAIHKLYVKRDAIVKELRDIN